MKPRMILRSAVVAAVGVAAVSCAHVKVDPIQVQTIHIVHDVNVSVDKALEDFFAFQEQQGTTHPATTQATTVPTTQTAASTGDVR